jgi:hypothetical protein
MTLAQFTPFSAPKLREIQPIHARATWGKRPGAIWTNWPPDFSEFPDAFEASGLTVAMLEWSCQLPDDDLASYGSSPETSKFRVRREAGPIADPPSWQPRQARALRYTHLTPPQQM